MQRDYPSLDRLLELLQDTAPPRGENCATAWSITIHQHGRPIGRAANFTMRREQPAPCHSWSGGHWQVNYPSLGRTFVQLHDVEMLRPLDASTGCTIILTSPTQIVEVEAYLPSPTTEGLASRVEGKAGGEEDHQD